MPFRIACPGCRAAFTLGDDLAGRKVRCQRCQKVFQVARPSSPPPAAPDDLVPVELVADGPPRGRPDAPGRRRRDDPAGSPPRPRPVQSSTPTGLIVGLSVGGFFVLLAGVIVVISLVLMSEDRHNVADRKDGGWKGGGAPAWQPPGGADAAFGPPGGEGMPWGPGGGPAGAGGLIEPPDIKLPPVRPVEMRPAALTQDRETVTLPGAIQDVAVGGGGRYLVLTLAEKRQIAVFDVCEAKVAGTIPVDANGVRVAAGMDKLVVVGPAGAVQRYDLATRQLEESGRLPVGNVRAVALGSASNGPLLVAFDNEAVFVDVFGFAPLDYRPDDVWGAGAAGLPAMAGPGFGPWAPPGAGGARIGLPLAGAQDVRASADGKVFCLRGGWGGPTVAELDGGWVHTYRPRDDLGHCLPGPDGQTVYTAHGPAAVRTREGIDGPRNPREDFFTLPADQGPFYLSITSGKAPAAADRLSLHAAGDTRPLLALGGVEAPRRPNPGAADPLGTDRRLHLVPDARVLITIPATNDRLVLHRLDVEAALEKADVDFLYVTSRPPTAKVTPGQPLEYRVTARSRLGGLAYRLDAAPEGMRVAADGLITWRPAADAPLPSAVDVVVAVSDRTGQEVYQQFRLRVEDRGGGLSGPAFPPWAGPGLPPGAAVPPPGGWPESEPRPVTKYRTTAVTPVTIKPPTLDGDRVEVDLPGPVGDVAVGGGGRFLILTLPASKQLAVFDANEGKVVKYLPVSEEKALIAAGMDRLFVALPEANLIQRWNLLTLERELSVPLQTRTPVQGLALGSASNGPLLVCAPRDFSEPGYFLDAKTMARSPLALEGFASGIPPAFLRVSADGRTFVFRHGGGGEPHGCSTLIVTGGRLQTAGAGVGPSLLYPAPDGRLIYSFGEVFDPELRQLAARKPDKIRPEQRATLPAHHGPYCVEVEARKLTFCTAGTELKPFDTLDAPEVGPGEYGSYGSLRDPLDAGKRVHLIPDAKLLVTLPNGNDKLILRRYDPEAALKKSQR